MNKFLAGLFSLSLVVAPLLPFAASPASARTVLSSKGGPGDRQDSDECPTGSYLVGFSGRVASGVEQIRIVCAPLERRAGVGRSEGPVRGGNAGDALAVNCQVRSAVFGIYALFTTGRQQVKRFNAFCRTADGQDQSPVVVAGPDNENIDGTTDRQDCPDSEIAIGVVINSGSQINGLALICDRIVNAATPSPSSGSNIAPRAMFGGKWRTVTSANGHFDMFLSPQGDGVIYPNGRLQEIPLQINGQFVNTDGASAYDGGLQGSSPPNSRVLIFGYTQKNGATGGGTLVLSNDGNSITGEGTASDGTKFTWRGRRAP